MSMAVSSNVGIPITDLSSFEDPSNTSEFWKTTKSIATACRYNGFFYVKHHGVSELTQDNFFNALKEFFSLPLEEKEKMKSQSTPGMVGYFKFQSETTAYMVDDTRDWREGLYAFGDELPVAHPVKEKFPLVTQRNLLPDQPANFKEILDAYHKELKLLGFKIMSALARGMGGWYIIAKSLYKLSCIQSGHWNREIIR